MMIDQQSIIGELVARDYKLAGVFQSYGIDFCCRGNRSLSEACERSSIPLMQLIEDLKLMHSRSAAQVHTFASMSSAELIEYILATHHTFVKNQIELILPLLDKVNSVHSEKHPELKEIQQLFVDVAAHLLDHMQKEEQVLFPAIERMEKEIEGAHIAHRFFLEHPIAMMRIEHIEEGDRFAAIARLSNNYSPPGSACASYRTAFAMLKEFEQDLQQHIHLENNILFPRFENRLSNKPTAD